MLMQCLYDYLWVCVSRGYKSHLGLTILKGVPCSLMLMMDWWGEKERLERDRERRLHFRFRSLAPGLLKWTCLSFPSVSRPE